ncbi:MAG: HupE/UreJ family protein [Rhizomicrobium sp.]
MKWMTAILFVVFAASCASAHEVRPAYLQIDEAAKGHYSILWKQPVVSDLALHLVPHLSSGWLERMPDSASITPLYRIETWNVTSPRSLANQTLTIEGLDRSITDVLVRANVREQRPFQAIVHPDQPSLVFAFEGAEGLRLPAYLLLGIKHILTGPDHLCFVLGLMLLVGLRWRLIKAITAFTVAHSITLAAAALGFVHFPSAVIEALVAMSILFLATELVHARRGEDGLTVRFPWLIAFTFGLLHGLAFAGALADVGLPPHAIPQALLLFNVGVELGQLMFVAAAAIVMIALDRIAQRLPSWWQSARGEIAPYAIGAFSAFWFIDRLATVFFQGGIS